MISPSGKLPFGNNFDIAMVGGFVCPSVDGGESEKYTQTYIENKKKKQFTKIGKHKASKNLRSLLK